MPEPKEIAIAALNKMIVAVGPDAEFPGDAIWEFADEEVEPLRKPPVFKMLSQDGYIEDTGEKTNAVTPERRSAPTTKYRFGPRLKPQSAAGLTMLSSVASKFSTECQDILRVQDSACVRLSASLLSKRFLVLTGLAGSGKTKLAQAFSRWITPKPEDNKDSNSHYAMLPVGADWTGNENVLGYPNGLNDTDYITKPALDLILHAKDHSDIPHFLVLDEMNLSHVERYFADFLSDIESEEEIQLHNGSERKANGKLVPEKIAIPKNLFIIGTVNVDETTYMFSPKVLDRANVIEFRMDAKELEAFLINPAKPDLSKLDRKGAAFGKAFVEAAKGSADIPAGVRSAYEVEMLLYFNVLQYYGAEFGYRVAHEAARFIHFYKLLGNYADDDTAWFTAAFDCVVVQKFLPKLHGSRAKLGPLLKALWFLATQKREYSAGESGNVKLGATALEEAQKKAADTNFTPSTLQAGNAPHPLSADKIARMWKLLNENGFASFAEA